MSGEKTDAWKLFKTNMARTKQRVLAKVGAAESTVDSKIQVEAEKLFTLFKLMKRLNKSVDKYNEIIKNIAITQNEMAHDILSFDEKDPNYAAFQECHRSMEAQRLKMEEYLETYYHDPLRQYLSQFREIQDRLAELDLRRLDMDRYFRDYSIKANKGKDATSLAKTEAKHQKTKEGYQTLSDELMRDIPLLFNDRQAVFDPAFACFINQNAQFFVSSSHAFNKAVTQVQNINEYQAANHQWVITPVEHSAMSKNVRSSSVFTSPTNYSSSPANSRPRASTIATTAPSSSSSGPTPYEPTAPSPSGVSLHKEYDTPPTNNTYQPPPQQQQQPSLYPTVPLSSPTQTSTTTSVGTNPNFRKSMSPTYSPPLGHSPKPMAMNPGSPTNTGRALPVPKPKPSQPIGVALFDFTGQDSTELTFSKGDRITLHSTSGDWLDGELNGVKGSVPNNYIQLQ